MDSQLILIATVGLLMFLVLTGAFVTIALCMRRVPSGTALVVRRPGGALVSFKNTVVLPFVHSAEPIDLAVRPVELDCRGKHGASCRDSIRADITLTLFLRVNRTAEDVLKVAETIGCARATDPQQLRELFWARFAEAVRSVASKHDFDAVHADRQRFKDEVIETIGRDLNGYVLDDVAVSHLEQTPIEQLDPSNILDAEAIRRITERTTEHNIRTNELRQRERLEISRQNLVADEERFHLEQQRAEAEVRARQGIHAQFLGKR